MATATSSAAAAAAAAAATATAMRVPPQGGILEGSNPSQYNPKDPTTLFIIQAGLIIIICHLLHWPLSKIRQPRVIAEVIGGIILGPSVMGHIPGFTNAIFPAASIPNLTLVANIGLILYLFMIGLETDVRFLASNWRVASSVAFLGLALPFGVGCGLAWGMFHAFGNEPGLKPISFAVFMLFVGIATAITAFPVLCRILTALKLLDTPVGIITLAAGVANDVVGWILLALCVTLVNAGNGLTTLYIFLVAVGLILFLFFLVKPGLLWLLRKTDNVKDGPSQTAISFILLIALGSAFFTGIIGIHPIFGGFVVGLIVPREDRFNIYVIEKLEDLVGAIFLPLYFTLSGLNTNLGLLNTGITWGYVFATTFTALFTKIIGATLAARLNGMVWRESLSIGVLMSCKGLVELIVLNIGLQAKILSTRTFTIFVVMALITTFVTTPLTTVLYPPWYQKKIAAWKRGEIDWDTGAPIVPASDLDAGGSDLLDKNSPQKFNRLLVYLRLDNMPGLLGLLSLFGGHRTPPETPASVSEYDSKRAAVETTTALGGAESPIILNKVVRAHGVRLLELSDRDSSVMTVAQAHQHSRHDPVVNTFRIVGQLNNIAASGEVSVMSEDHFAEALLASSTAHSSDLLLVPWTKTGSINDSQILFSANIEDRLASNYTDFVRSILSSREHNIGVFFPRSSDESFSSSSSDSSTTKGWGRRDRDRDQHQHQHSGQRGKLVRGYSYDVSKPDFPTAALPDRLRHIFLAYFGGNDDKLALSIVLQLLEREEVVATVAHAASDDTLDLMLANLPDRTRQRIKTEKLTTDHNNSISVEEILACADEAQTTPTPPHDASQQQQQQIRGKLSLIILGHSTAPPLDGGKLPFHKAREDVRSCVGILGDYFIASGVVADILVVQAKA